VKGGQGVGPLAIALAAGGSGCLPNFTQGR